VYSFYNKYSFSDKIIARKVLFSHSIFKNFPQGSNEIVNTATYISASDCYKISRQMSSKELDIKMADVSDVRSKKGTVIMFL
jgi:hypothetical protein